MKKILFISLSVLIFCRFAQAQEIVTAKQVNGTWRYKSNEISVFALGHNKLKVQFDLCHEWESPFGLTGSVGYALGEADIEGTIATFFPPDTEGCKITMKFTNGDIIVEQEEKGHLANCGFGSRVSADGTYKKISGKKPKFGGF